MTRVVLIPGVLALLPEYASIDDPMAELRGVCLDAVGWLAGPVELLGDEQARRVGEWAVEAAGVSTTSTPKVARSYLAVGNGSAKRSDEAPGYFDDRAAAFDAELGRCLKEGRSESLREIDMDLAGELWASVAGIVALGEIPDIGRGDVLYADDPFGVQYWVMRWQCAH